MLLQPLDKLRLISSMRIKGVPERREWPFESAILPGCNPSLYSATVNELIQDGNNARLLTYFEVASRYYHLATSYIEEINDLDGTSLITTDPLLCARPLAAEFDMWQSQALYCLKIVDFSSALGAATSALEACDGLYLIERPSRYHTERDLNKSSCDLTRPRLGPWVCGSLRSIAQSWQQIITVEYWTMFVVQELRNGIAQWKQSRDISRRSA